MYSDAVRRFSASAMSGSAPRRRRVVVGKRTRGCYEAIVMLMLGRRRFQLQTQDKSRYSVAKGSYVKRRCGRLFRSQGSVEKHGRNLCRQFESSYVFALVCISLEGSCVSREVTKAKALLLPGQLAAVPTVSSRPDTLEPTETTIAPEPFPPCRQTNDTTWGPSTFWPATHKSSKGTGLGCHSGQGSGRYL